MKTKVKVALIGAGATILSASIGVVIGKSYEQNMIQNQIDKMFGNNINIVGDGNKVSINDVQSLIESYLQLQDDYNKLQSQNNYLVGENSKISSELDKSNKAIIENQDEANKKIEELNSQINSIPVIEYKDLSLCIDANDVPISSNQSTVTINGRDYFSKEIVNELITEDKSLTIKDGTIYIGKVVAEKANLLDQYVKSNLRCYFIDSVQDSFGYIHTDCLSLDDMGYGNSEIEFSLQNKYDLLDCKLSVHGNYTNSQHATITIKADEKVIKAIEITEDTETITIEGLAINRCSRLTISKQGSTHFKCIISDAVIYN